MSTVILYLAFLEAEAGQQTRQSGRTNLHWATRGTPGNTNIQLFHKPVENIGTFKPQRSAVLIRWIKRVKELERGSTCLSIYLCSHESFPLLQKRLNILALLFEIKRLKYTLNIIKSLRTD